VVVLRGLTILVSTVSQVGGKKRIMSRFKFLTLLAVILLMTLPVGLVQAEEAKVPIRIAVISNNVASSDAITFTLAEITPPAEGKVYEGWLVSDDGSESLSVGVMNVQDDGTINHIYSSPGASDLLALYSKVTITEESVPDEDVAPSSVVVFGHIIPLSGITDIRGAAASAFAAQAQIGIAIDHADLALGATTLDLIRSHMHHVINLIEGDGGDNYDAVAGTPANGDGIGILSHAQSIQSYPDLAVQNIPGDKAVSAHAPLVKVNAKNAEDWAAQARDVAVQKALLEEDIALAKIWVQESKGLLQAAKGGIDADLDGTVGSVVGEGGADRAYVEAQLMATYTLEPGSPAPSAPVLPVVGDSLVPLLAQIALVASLVLLVGGGALTIRGWRSRA